MPYSQTYRGTAAVAFEGPKGWNRAALVSTEGNRWSRDGEPTIYLAGDDAVALAEFARHMSMDSRPRVGSLWTVELNLDRLVDVRGAEVGRQLSIPTEPGWILDADRCREVATTLRRRDAAAMLVPSVAFLDRPDRVNIVIFADKVRGVLEDTIRNPRRVATIRAT